MEDDIADLQVHAVDEHELRESLLSQVRGGGCANERVAEESDPSWRRQRHMRGRFGGWESYSNLHVFV